MRVHFGWKGKLSASKVRIGEQRKNRRGTVIQFFLKSGRASNGPLARQLTRSLPPPTHSLAPHSSLRSLARSLIRSRARGTMEYFCSESQWNDHEIDALSTGPFTRPLARSLAMHTHSLSPHCSLRLRAPLRSFGRSLARLFTHS